MRENRDKDALAKQLAEARTKIKKHVDTMGRFFNLQRTDKVKLQRLFSLPIEVNKIQESLNGYQEAIRHFADLNKANQLGLGGAVQNYAKHHETAQRVFTKMQEVYSPSTDLPSELQALLDEPDEVTTSHAEADSLPSLETQIAKIEADAQLSEITSLKEGIRITIETLNQLSTDNPNAFREALSDPDALNSLHENLQQYGQKVDAFAKTNKSQNLGLDQKVQAIKVSGAKLQGDFQKLCVQQAGLLKAKQWSPSPSQSPSTASPFRRKPINKTAQRERPKRPVYDKVPPRYDHVPPEPEKPGAQSPLDQLGKTVEKALKESGDTAPPKKGKGSAPSSGGSTPRPGGSS